MNLWAGTSGYSYKEWKGSFYPKDLAAAEMLSFYASKLPSVEINNTFYRLPKSSVIETWAQQVPQNFRFSIKASRRITHMKRLKDAGDETTYLLETVQKLGSRLGVVLYQCPPNLKKDLPRLEDFIAQLSGETPAVFEFRHESWFDDEVYDCLRARKCALVLADNDDADEPQLVSTAKVGYLRLRRAKYTKAALGKWLTKINDAGWDEAYVFFKHEDGGIGPKTAGQFLELAR